MLLELYTIAIFATNTHTPKRMVHWSLLRKYVIILECDTLKFFDSGGRLNKTVLPGMAIPMLKIRRPNGRLIFNMEIAIRR